MPVYNKRGILLLPKVIVLNPKDGTVEAGVKSSDVKNSEINCTNQKNNTKNRKNKLQKCYLHLHTLDYSTRKVHLQAKKRLIVFSDESDVFIRIQPIGYFLFHTV